MTAVLSIVLLLSALGAACLGCGCLALSQSKHRRAVLDGKHGGAHSGRLGHLGWAILGMSFIPCALRDGLAFAVLTWPLILGIAACLTALILAYRPMWLRNIYGCGTSIFGK